MLNSQKQTSYYLILHLWKHISFQRRRQFGALLFLVICTSFIEIASIGSVLPFLSAIANPDHLYGLREMRPVIDLLDLDSANQLLILITIGFGLTAMIAGGLRLMLLWANSHLAYGVGADLSIDMYQKTLNQPYLTHISRNSSEVINGISFKAAVVISVIASLLNLIGYCVILMAILVSLIYINPIVTLSTFSSFGGLYFMIIWFTRERQAKNSYLISRESTQVIKCLQEGLGGIRDILVDGTQEFYCKLYSDADRRLRDAQSSNQFIAGCPRYAMEALGMAIIAVLTLFLSQQENGILMAIPTLGVLAIGSQRLLPILQQCYQSYVGITSQRHSLIDALQLLDQSSSQSFQHSSRPITLFEREIVLKRLSFKYDPSTPYVLKDINLTISKGARIGFIGSTGSGKSTLVDIVLGLLPATEGCLLVDGKEVTRENSRGWQDHIAHVPQSIFLADASIMENIAFGVALSKINFEKVKVAARLANIASTIEGWSKQYDTVVGERGVRLSGGQRQRIGIARALYSNADVIVFDEATSALDSETERSVMSEIENLSSDLTLLIVAHRISTLKSCSQIVELENARIKRIVNYDEICNERDFS